MATKLLRSGIWARLTSRVRANRRKCKVAVAYFGQGASRLLPLAAGSTLVVDMSERAVREGQTCPADVNEMLQRRVRVYSNARLHAKVFVCGSVVIVGSNNASRRSKDVLIEAAIETSDPATLRACNDFVRDQCKRRITTEDVERLAPLYNPPSGGGTAHRNEHQSECSRPLWALALGRIEWDDEDTRQADQARPLARKDLGDRKRFRLEEFCWTGNDLGERVSEGDLALQVLTESDKRVLIHPPARIIRVIKYHVGRSPRVIVFLREPRKRPKQHKQVMNRLDAPSKRLRKLKRLSLVRSAKLADELHGLWGLEADDRR